MYMEIVLPFFFYRFYGLVRLPVECDRFLCVLAPIGFCVFIHHVYLFLIQYFFYL